MAISLLASVTLAGSGGTTSAINTTGASLLVAIQTGTRGSPGVPVDSQSNSWSQLTTQGGATNGNISYVDGPTTGASQTFTMGANGNGILVAAFSGILTSGAFDQQNGDVVFVSGNQPGSITPLHNNELIISAATCDASGDSSSPSASGMSVVVSLPSVSGAATPGLYLATVVQATATAINPTWSISGGSNLGALLIASFQAAATVTNSWFFAS